MSKLILGYWKSSGPTPFQPPWWICQCCPEVCLSRRLVARSWRMSRSSSWLYVIYIYIHIYIYTNMFTSIIPFIILIYMYIIPFIILIWLVVEPTLPLWKIWWESIGMMKLLQRNGKIIQMFQSPPTRSGSSLSSSSFSLVVTFVSSSCRCPTLGHPPCYCSDRHGLLPCVAAGTSRRACHMTIRCQRLRRPHERHHQS